MDVYLRSNDGGIATALLDVIKSYDGRFVSRFGTSERNGIHTITYEFPGLQFLSVQLSKNQPNDTSEEYGGRIIILDYNWAKKNGLYEDLNQFR